MEFLNIYNNKNGDQYLITMSCPPLAESIKKLTIHLLLVKVLDVDDSWRSRVPLLGRVYFGAKINDKSDDNSHTDKTKAIFYMKEFTMDQRQEPRF